MKKNFNISIMSNIVFFLSAVLLVGCGKETAEDTNRPDIRPVKMLTLTSVSNVETFRFPAIVDAGRYAEMSFQVGGLVDKIRVIRSQKVKQGDILISLDQRDLKNRLVTAQAQYNSALSEYKRGMRLLEENAIASSVVEQRDMQKDISKAQLDSAKKALDDSVLRAPFSGTVANISVRGHQNVTAGQLALQLINMDTMQVSINIPEAIVRRALQYDSFVSYVILEELPNMRILSKQKDGSFISNPATQTYLATGIFTPPPELRILPGMNATVEIEAINSTKSNKLAVPIAAIFSEGNANFVWVVNKDTMLVMRREVVIEDGLGEFIVITEGLESNETIAVAGASYLTDGMQVRLWKND